MRVLLSTGFLALIGVAALEAVTVTQIRVRQVDYTQFGQVIVPRSNAADVRVTFQPDARGTTWLSIVQLPATGSSRWVVRNMPLLAADFTRSAIFNLGTYMDLGVPTGTDLVGKDFHFFYVLSDAPLQTAPASGVEGTVTIGSTTVVLNAGIAGGPSSATTASVTAPEEAAAPSIEPAIPAGDENAPTVGDPDMPNVVQGSQQCFPGAIANSLHWLAKKNGIDLKQTLDQTLADLAMRMSTDSAKGTQLDAGIRGLAGFAPAHNLSLNMEYQVDPGFDFGLPQQGDLKDNAGKTLATNKGKVSYEFIRDEKAKGQNIVLIFYNDANKDQSGRPIVQKHAAVLEAVDPATQSLVVRDDPNQHGPNSTESDKQEVNDKHDTITPNAGVYDDLARGRIRAVVAESPVRTSLNTSPTSIGTTWYASMNPVKTDDKCGHNSSTIPISLGLLPKPNGALQVKPNDTAPLMNGAYDSASGQFLAQGQGPYRNIPTQWQAKGSYWYTPWGPAGHIEVSAGTNGSLPGGCPITWGADLWATNPFTTASETGSLLVADPVASGTGELVEAPQPDFSFSGPLPFAFKRYYASFLKQNEITGALGNNWTHNFEQGLIVGGGLAVWLGERGRTVVFRQSGQNWQLTGPSRWAYQLINASGGYRLLDPETNLTYLFASSGLLTRIEDRNGNALVITPSQLGPTQITDNLGRTLTLTYSGGYLAEVRDQSGRRVSFTYTGDSLTQVRNVAGGATSLGYINNTTATSLLTAATLPAGNKPYTQAYDSLARVSRQTDSGGNATSFAYQAGGPGNTAVTPPLQNVTRLFHDDLTTLTAMADALGRSSSFNYDANARLSAITDRLGNRSSVTYHDASGNVASATDAAGNTTSFTWTAQSQGGFTFYVMTGIRYPDGSTATVTYDAKGNALAIRDRAARLMQFTYNERGQPLTFTHPAGGVYAYAYNADGTLASIKNPAGDTETFSYDDGKRPKEHKYADGASTVATFDARDLLTQMTNELGRSAAYVYDANGNLKSAADLGAAQSSFTYDGNDRVATAVDTAQSRTSYTYDAAGRLSSTTDGAGARTAFGYDALGRLATVTDTAGSTTRYGFDAEGRLDTLTDPLQRSIRFTRDALGRAASITAAGGEVMQLSYAPTGELTSMTDPLGGIFRFAFANGLLTGISLPGGVSAALARGDAGLVKSITDPGGSIWNLTYDAMGRLTARTDPAGRTTTLRYDNRGRVAEARTPSGSATFTYDAVGNLLRRLYSDGTDLKYTYDANNRLLTANGAAFSYDAAGRLSSSNGIGIDRDPVGHIIAVRLAPDKVIRYGRDAAGRVTQVTDWMGSTTSLQYDAAGQLTGILRPNGVSTAYTFNANGLTSGIVEQTDSVLASIQISRDAAGRPISANRNLPQLPNDAPGVLPLSYDGAQQIAGATYDDAGRLTTDALAAYQWDASSRLTALSGARGAATYAYDGLNQRVSRTVGDATQNYILNYALGLPTVAISRDGGGNDLKYFVHLPGGLLLYSIDAATGGRAYYHYDESGSTTLLTDDAGQVTDAYGISPYGETVTHMGSSDNPFTYQGAYGVMQEEASGLYYMRYRYYDSTTARFLSPDPVLSLHPQDLNPYQFARQTPLTLADPLGLNPTAGGIAAPTLTMPAQFKPFAAVLQNCISFNPGPQVGTPAVPNPNPTLPSAAPSLQGYPNSILASATPGFQGFIMATCQFQFSPGFPFTSESFNWNVSIGDSASLFPEFFKCRR